MQLTVNAGRPASSRKTSRLHALTVRRVSCTDVHSPLVHTLTPLFWAKIIQQQLVMENYRWKYWWRNHAIVFFFKKPLRGKDRRPCPSSARVWCRSGDRHAAGRCRCWSSELGRRRTARKRKSIFVRATNAAVRVKACEASCSADCINLVPVQGRAVWKAVGPPPPKKVQMWPFNISKDLGRCVLFRSSCKLPLEQSYFKT